ncbi:MAG: hypothetical protein ACR2K1_15115 [Saprospiraceae bacterium]
MKLWILVPVTLCVAGALISQAPPPTNPDVRRSAALSKVRGVPAGSTTPKGAPNERATPTRSVIRPIVYYTPPGSGEAILLKPVNNPGSGAPRTTAKGLAASADLRVPPPSGPAKPAPTRFAPSDFPPPVNPDLRAGSLVDIKPAPARPAMYSVEPPAAAAATTVKIHGHNAERAVRIGRGPEGEDLFTPVGELYYVQFAVYCREAPVDKAPAIEGLYLLWHPGTRCPDGAQGASYIVKGFTTVEEAKAAVKAYKAARIDCWYNPMLSGAEVEIIGVR